MAMLGYVDLGEEAEAAGGMLGGGIMNLAGFESKQDALQRIWENTDWEDEEQTDKALAKIRRIDPDVWSQAIKRQGEEADYQAKRGIPKLNEEWRAVESKAFTMDWANKNLSFYKELPSELQNPTDDAGITKALIWLGYNDDNLPTGKAGMLASSYRAALKEAQEYYMKINKYSHTSKQKEQTRPLTSIKGRSSYI